MSAVQRPIEEVTTTQIAPGEQDTVTKNSSPGVALMRIVLGLVTLSVWFSNVTDDPNFYSTAGLRGFFDWAFLSEEEGGNGGTFTFIGSLFDAIEDAGLLGVVGFAQMIIEFLIGIALVFGVATRLFSLLAIAFFVGLGFTFFGGEEWFGSYILLVGGAVTVFLSWGGRTFGIDRAIATARGDSPGKLIW